MRYVILLALLLTPSSAWAAISHVQAFSNGGTAGGTTATLTANGVVGGSGHVMACAVTSGSNTTPSSLADGTNGSYSYVGGVSGTGGVRVDLFYFKNVTGGNLTLTATWPSDPGAFGIGCHEISGADTTSPVDTAAGTSISVSCPVTDQNVTNTLTTSADGEYIYVAVMEFNGTTLTAGSGFTLKAAIAGDIWDEYQIQTSAGSIQGTMSCSSGTFQGAGAGITYKAGTGGGGGGGGGTPTTKRKGRIL